MRSSVDLPEPLRPTRHTRSPADTDSSAPSSSGVPPKVRAMSESWTRGGAIGREISRHAWEVQCALQSYTKCGHRTARVSPGSPDERSDIRADRYDLPAYRCAHAG